MYKKKKNIFLLFVFLLLSISIGYALLSSNIKINGISKMFNSKWDIHFNNVVYNEGNVTLSENDKMQ